jgi:predicted RNA-binding Zn-ribbon protein involved in translation (DUF1610 family)
MSMDKDQNQCPECGNALIVNRDGSRECYSTWNGIELSCGWREDPILDLADPAP